MFHDRLLIGFLNTSFGNTVKKKKKKKKIFKIHHFVSLSLSCIFHFVEQTKKQKQKTKRNNSSRHQGTKHLCPSKGEGVGKS